MPWRWMQARNAARVTSVVNAMAEVMDVERAVARVVAKRAMKSALTMPTCKPQTRQQRRPKEIAATHQVKYASRVKAVAVVAMDAATSVAHAPMPTA